VLEPGETCDSACPTSCSDGLACTSDLMAGSPATCDVVCSYPPITTCTPNDLCCPAGCDASTDSDCLADAGVDGS
jgi:hypothetical protein